MCGTELDDVRFIWVEGETIRAEQNLKFGQTLYQPRQSGVLALFVHMYAELCTIGVQLLIKTEE